MSLGQLSINKYLLGYETGFSFTRRSMASRHLLQDFHKCIRIPQSSYRMKFHRIITPPSVEIFIYIKKDTIEKPFENTFTALPRTQVTSTNHRSITTLIRNETIQSEIKLPLSKKNSKDAIEKKKVMSVMH